MQRAWEVCVNSSREVKECFKLSNSTIFANLCYSEYGYLKLSIKEETMKINHIAMYVDDLEKSREFYMHYFGAKANQKYKNSKTGLETYFLCFEEDTRLEIMTRPDMENTEKGLKQAGLIHLAFSVGTRKKVDELTKTLKNAGYSIISEPRVTGDGYYESCVLDPENNQIEIVE